LNDEKTPVSIIVDEFTFLKRISFLLDRDDMDIIYELLMVKSFKFS
jgi:hypothetical protein